MVDDADAGLLDTKEFGNLCRGERRNGNHEIRPARGVPGLLSETGPKFGRRVISAQNKQIMKRGNGAFVSRGRQTLVQPVKQIELPKRPSFK